jgi:tRNA(Glu) U13 pseudouridine synthase TruD
VDDHGGYITLAFTLPAGAFATVVMRELMKSDAEEAATTADSADDAAPDSLEEEE